ncbi:NUDIX hydrolase [Thalassoporum mexicanum PCC 7367]|uniref:NUDIX hydrolase n=1 Tax=Thalassoporum mexicanum TaxID=3457544 RepID=UPI00029FA231|nr:NUDIX domain-containing protein [Pseudanabaena sp. PCC 7367]AFY68870.1 NUDIX hydrolase [Pseudanabaena sp. PCC 7367]
MSKAFAQYKPTVAVDCVVFGLDRQDLKVMLIKRGVAPFKGDWALPGGFVQLNESLDQAAKRELEEETGIKQAFLEQLYTFGAVNRDPRDRIITVAYYALVNLWEHQIRATTDASDAAWFAIANLPKLAFDHDQILQVALQRLQGKLRYQPIGFELLPQKFTLTQLQTLYEIVLDQKLDKRNFRKKILKMNLLIDLNERETGVSHRAARLYRFDKKRYEQLRYRGFSFEI